jgi:hypothetical protein
MQEDPRSTLGRVIGEVYGTLSFFHAFPLSEDLFIPLFPQPHAYVFEWKVELLHEHTYPTTSETR